MDTRGLILNTAYNDFILDSNISNYLYKNHTKRFYNESTFTNSSYYFYDDEIDIWCDDDGNINTIRCASSGSSVKCVDGYHVMHIVLM